VLQPLSPQEILKQEGIEDQRQTTEADRQATQPSESSDEEDTEETFEEREKREAKEADTLKELMGFPPEESRLQPLTQQRNLLAGNESPSIKHEATSVTLTRDSAKPAAKRKRKETTSEVIISGAEEAAVTARAEYIDVKSGRKFSVIHGIPYKEGKDELYDEITARMSNLRTEITDAAFASPFRGDDLRCLSLDSLSRIVPYLISKLDDLRSRRPKEDTYDVVPKQLQTYLTKIKQQAEISLGVLAKTVLPTNTQKHDQIMFELLGTTDKMTVQEHNDLLAANQNLVLLVAEKIRWELSVMHAALLKYGNELQFQEQRAAGLWRHVLDSLNCTEAPLPAFLIQWLKPDTHPCQCQECSPNIRALLRNELLDEVKTEVAQQLRKQVHEECSRDIENELRGKVREELTPQIREEMREDVRDAIASEIRAEVIEATTAELRANLAPIIKQELIEEADRKKIQDDRTFKQEQAAWETYLQPITDRVFGKRLPISSKYFKGYAAPALQLPGHWSGGEGAEEIPPPAHISDVISILLVTESYFKQPQWDQNLIDTDISERLCRDMRTLALSTDLEHLSPATKSYVEAMDTNYQSTGNLNPEQLDELRKQAVAALSEAHITDTQSIQYDEEIHRRRVEFDKNEALYIEFRSQQPPLEPGEKESEEVVRRKLAIEDEKAALNSIVDQKWSTGYRWRLSVDEVRAKLEWEAIYVTIHLEHGEMPRSEQETQWDEYIEARVEWEKKIAKAETKNRERVLNKLQAENKRRSSLKLGEKDSGYPISIPREFIELSEEQLKDIERINPEPQPPILVLPRPGDQDEKGIEVRKQQRQRSRQLNLASYAKMEETARKQYDMSAIDYFVHWQSTTGAAEVDEQYRIAMAREENGDTSWTELDDTSSWEIAKEEEIPHITHRSSRDEFSYIMELALRAYHSIHPAGINRSLTSLPWPEYLATITNNTPNDSSIKDTSKLGWWMKTFEDRYHYVQY